MSFAVLALISFVALLGPIFSLPRTIAVPVVVGELIVGIVLGTTGLRILDSTEPTFHFLAQIGFALVMFVAGTHVPVRSPHLRSGLAGGLIRAAVVGALAVPAGMGLAAFFGTDHGLIYAVLIASSSAAIVMPTLGDVELRGRTGMQMLAQIAVADAACIVALPLVVEPAKAGSAALGSGAVILGALAVFGLLRWAVVSGEQERLHRVSKSEEFAAELRIVLALVFSLAALAVLTGVSVMLAGFAMGLAVAAAGEPKRLARQVFGLTEGFFAPLFFVWLGASLNLRQLIVHPEAIVLGLCLGLTAVAVHGALALSRQPWPAAVSTSAQLGVPVAAVTMGTDAGVLSGGEPGALLLGALVTIVAVIVCAKPLRAAISSDADGRTGS